MEQKPEQLKRKTKQILIISIANSKPMESLGETKVIFTDGLA